jgi:hypothetical protein
MAREWKRLKAATSIQWTIDSEDDYIIFEKSEGQPFGYGARMGLTRAEFQELVRAINRGLRRKHNG